MERTSGVGKAEYQTTWSVLVLRIILNHLGVIQECFFQFSNTDAPNNTLVNGMFREFILSLTNFFNNFIEQ